MSKDDPQGIAIHILGKEYLVACEDGEQADLLDSAKFLDQKMREIRDTGKVVGTDRIAVMAALNLAHEILHQKSGVTLADKGVENKIRDIQAKIEDALYRSRQLEIEA